MKKLFKNFVLPTLLCLLHYVIVISWQDKSLGARLHTGDFYLTKHSNLAEVHAVFHLVVDEAVRTGDITSRHPAILSIRNIIRLCFRYDIHTLTIPLLLTHEMTEVRVTLISLEFGHIRGFASSPQWLFQWQLQWHMKISTEFYSIKPKFLWKICRNSLSVKTSQQIVRFQKSYSSCAEGKIQWKFSQVTVTVTGKVYCGELAKSLISI